MLYFLQRSYTTKLPNEYQLTTAILYVPIGARGSVLNERSNLIDTIRLKQNSHNN